MNSRWIEITLSHWTEIGVQATCLALLILLAAHAARRASAPLAYGLLLIALVKFALPALPSPTALMPWMGERLQLSQLAGEASAAPTPTLSIVVDDFAGEQITAPMSVVEAFPWPEALFLAYALVAALLLLRLGMDQRLLARWTAQARVCDDPAVSDVYLDLCRRLGLRRTPRLLIADEASTPIAFGLWKPTVLIPAALLKGLDPAALRAVLGHELAHHRRGDLWVHAVQRILAAVWWFNPVFHVLDRALRKTQEECCDDLVTRRGLADDRVYCRALVETADLCAGAPTVPAACGVGMADRFQPLADRLERLLDGRRRRELGRLGVVALLLAAVVVLPGRGLVAAPAESEAALLRSQVTALQELQVRSLWPRFVLDRLGALPSLEVEVLELTEAEFFLASASAELQDVATSVEVFSQDPVEAELRWVVQRDTGVESHLALRLNPSAGLDVGAAVDASVVTKEQRDLLVGALLVERSSAEELVRTVHGIFEESGALVRELSPNVRVDRGLYQEWPVAFGLEGEREAQLEVLDRLSRLPGVLVERIDWKDGDLLEGEFRVLTVAEDLATAAAPAERWFEVSLQRLRSIAEDLDC